MSVTIKDIARIAKVSHTTVSRALNNSPLINDETKQRIREIARNLNYSPNVSAKSLVLHRSFNIGLFFSTLEKGTSSGFFHETVRGVNAVIKDRFNLVVKGIDDYADFHSVTPRSFDGIIIMSQSDNDNTFIRSNVEKDIPQIVLNREVDFGGISILANDFEGASQIVEYLIEQGHRDIALIEGKETFHSSRERTRGFVTTLGKHGIPVRESWRRGGEYDLESGYKAMKDLLALSDRPTAVFCSNDEMAVGAVKAANEAGLQVPGDLSVAGFDDHLFARYISPALTTVRRPIEEISRMGAERLLEQIEAKQIRGERIYLNTRLIVRESVSPARH